VPGKVLRSVFPAAILLVVAAAFYWKLTATSEYIWFDHVDMCVLELPRLEFQAREFHRGRFPLWDPHIWMGQPLIGMTQPGPLHPLNIAFLLLPLTADGHLRFDFLNYYFVFLHFLAALGFYLLCRGLRRSPAASIAGACVYSFAGFMGSAPWLDVLMGAIWIPYVCHFFLRAVRANSLACAGLAGFFAGLMWLSGHHEIPLLTMLALAAAFAYARAWRAATIAFPIAALVGAAQIWPMLEFGRLAKRWGPANGPVGWNDSVAYASSSVYSLTPRALAGLVFPGQGTNADSSVFLGIVAMAMASLALLSLWRLKPVRWFTALAAASTIFSLGAFTPVHGWLYTLIPMLSKARVPARGTVLLHLALAVLAAYGAGQLLNGRARDLVKRTGQVTAVLGALIIIAAAIFKMDLHQGSLVTAFAGIAFYPVARFWPKLLLLLMLTEWTTAFTLPWKSKHENAFIHANALRKHADIAEFLSAQSGAVRARVNDVDVRVNFGDLYSIDMLEGYTAGATANLLNYARHTHSAQRLFAVTHYVGRQPDLPATLERVFAGRDDALNVYRLTNPLPRARAVHQAETVSSTALLSHRIENPNFDAGNTVLLVNESARLQPCQPGTVRIISYAPNRVRLSADMNCRGMVVLADTFFPGWEAAVDGRSSKIYQAYGSLRAIVVGAGHHQVEFHFRPLSVYGGLLLTAAGFLLTLLCLARVARR
jgi:hypothetical protein